jgi:hypothetical protein
MVLFDVSVADRTVSLALPLMRLMNISYIVPFTYVSQADKYETCG